MFVQEDEPKAKSDWVTNTNRALKFTKQVFKAEQFYKYKRFIINACFMILSARC